MQKLPVKKEIVLYRPELVKHREIQNTSNIKILRGKFFASKRKIPLDFYFILFHFILFHFILFYFILFHFILFYFFRFLFMSHPFCV